jgi:hypothetical protein
MHLEEEKEREKEGEETKLRISVGLVGGWVGGHRRVPGSLIQKSLIKRVKVYDINPDQRHNQTRPIDVWLRGAGPKGYSHSI